MADTLNANIMITDLSGNIEYCVGMGMDMRDVAQEKINVVGHHGMPWKESDLEALIDGMAGSEAKRQKYLGNIHEEILRLRRLVGEILDLQKIEAGRLEMKMRMKEISLPDIAGRVTGKFQSLPAQYLYERKLAEHFKEGFNPCL